MKFKVSPEASAILLVAPIMAQDLQKTPKQMEIIYKGVDDLYKLFDDLFAEIDRQNKVIATFQQSEHFTEIHSNF